MSRPINSLNKNSIVQSSSILQVITSQGPSTVTIAGGAATLSLDNLFVKNIYLLDTLHAKLTVDVNAPDKLTISKGSIINKVISPDPLNEVLLFNNVSFQPDLNYANIVNIYTDNVLKIGKLNTGLDLISSNLNLFSDKTINFYADSNIYGNLYISGYLTVGTLNVQNIISIGNIYGQGNLIIKDNIYAEGNIINISNVNNSSNLQINFLGTNSGQIEFSPNEKLFRINPDIDILGNVNITGNLTVINELIISNVIIYENSNITKNLTIEGNLLVYKDTIINGNLNVANIKINNELNINNNILIGETDLKYNGNIILTINDSNIVNVSNIIIVDNTNLLDVLFDVKGNITCNNIYLTSNVNKKKNIREITDDEIERLNIIKSYNFDLKSNGTNNYGFLAHEIQEIYPILSNGDSVNYVGFIPLLLEKIKLLENKIKNIERILNISI